jgi:hypothetical protein
MPFDFSFYIELCIIFGISNSFNIGIGEWLVLLVACLLGIKSIGDFESYQIFTVLSFVMLLLSIFVVYFCSELFMDIIRDSFGVDDPNDFHQLSAVVKNPEIAFLEREIRRESCKAERIEKEEKKRLNSTKIDKPTSRQSEAGHHKFHHHYFENFIRRPHNPHIHHDKHSSTHRHARFQPTQNKMFIHGIPLTERDLRKFVQRMVLVTCFYISMFLVSNHGMKVVARVG